MLKNSKAFSGFSVSDTEKAGWFYKDILGLNVQQGMEGILEIHINGSTPVIAYPKEGHVPATFTVLNFPVPDIEKAVAELKQRGVTFESYNSRELTTDPDNIFRGGGPHIAWFKDPSDNIFSIIQEE